MYFKTKKNILKIFFSLCIIGALYLGYLMVVSNKNSSLKNSDLDTLFYASNDPDPNMDYKIILRELVFKGVDQNANFYTLSAKQALKDSNDQYRLKYINMVYDLGSERSLHVSSQNALLDEKTRILDLKNEVKFFFEDIFFCGNEIQIDLIKHDIISNSSITFSHNNSKTTANSLSTRDNNNLIILKGNVCTTIYLPTDE